MYKHFCTEQETGKESIYVYTFVSFSVKTIEEIFNLFYLGQVKMCYYFTNNKLRIRKEFSALNVLFIFFFIPYSIRFLPYTVMLIGDLRSRSDDRMTWQRSSNTFAQFSCFWDHIIFVSALWPVFTRVFTFFLYI